MAAPEVGLTIRSPIGTANRIRIERMFRNTIVEIWAKLMAKDHLGFSPRYNIMVRIISTYPTNNQQIKYSLRHKFTVRRRTLFSHQAERELAALQWEHSSGAIKTNGIDVLPREEETTLMPLRKTNSIRRSIMEKRNTTAKKKN